ncbi:zinc finger matrin-type protein 5 [Strongylocentrotus purpuratus]|uniref:Zinc finger matrin-type protein 5 n=1 Tax=Strongylocentrotus purpuratus TaxID=7668 RepID=A0A7M7RCI8_STRPU|nr:zinc finger matrin-type protein 5 [Strongylocentrotus purpuratus]
MGKRYYCDYCDKTFADNSQNRKKHLNGVVHDRLRKLHYSLFREPEDILSEEKAKIACLKLKQSGFCTFEGSCRYSHLTPEKERELLEKIEAKKLAAQAAEDLAADLPEPSLDDWLAKRSKRKKNKDTTSSSTSSSEGVHPSGGSAVFKDMEFSLPPELQNIPDLPPSMIPPSSECFTETAEWGS